MTEHALEYSDLTKSPNISLSITFTGPLLFDFHKGSDTTVDVYAPYCPFHEAGIFSSYSSLSETNLWNCVQQKEGGPIPPSERAYTVFGEGIEACSRAPQIIAPEYPCELHKDDSSAFVLSADKFGGLKLCTHKVFFKISVPRPALIYPLYMDSVEVVPDYDPKSITGKMIHHCTGLRFFYKWDACSPVILKLPRNHSCSITPPILPRVPKLGDIEIRYQGFEITDQNDNHADARSCFASVAALAGLTCWLNYGDGKSCPTNPSPAPPVLPTASHTCDGVDPGGVGVLIHNGGDCQAPIVANGLDGI